MTPLPNTSYRGGRPVPAHAGNVAQAVLELYPTVLLRREASQHLRGVDRPRRTTLVVLDPRVVRIGELEGPLVVQELGDILLGPDGLLPLPGARDLLAQLDRLEGGQIPGDVLEVAGGGDATRHYRLRGVAGEVHRVLQHDEGAVGVAQDRVLFQRPRKRATSAAIC